MRLPDHGIHVASASPELFLRRDGDVVTSSPIKGTASTRDGFTAKDRAENVMIVDLVRNDFGRVCEFGSVACPRCGRWSRTLGCAISCRRSRAGCAAMPAGPTSSPRPSRPVRSPARPKLAAIDHLRRLEPVERGVYCGAVGWVDADNRRGELNVAIRTFWFDDGMIHFGTGGAITWDSTPEGEWEETELKARRLLRVASGQPVGALS